MNQPILWPKYYLVAAMQYLVDRNCKPALVIDNAVLQDGVLATRQKVSGDDCVICVAAGYVANWDVGDFGVSFSVKFNGFYHFMEIPFEAISAIFAYQSTQMITDDGEMNVFTLPKVVVAPGATRRKEKAKAKDEQEAQAILLNLEEQPGGDTQSSNAPVIAHLKKTS